MSFYDFITILIMIIILYWLITIQNPIFNSNAFLMLRH